MVKGKQLVHYNGHENSPICCAFTPDGKQAVTGDSISRIRVWDSATGATLRKLDGRGQKHDGRRLEPGRPGDRLGNAHRRRDDRRGGPLERTFCLRNLDFGPPPDKTFVRGQAAAWPAADGLQRRRNAGQYAESLSS